MNGRTLRQFGVRVRKTRVALGISQEQLAERAGCHRNYVGLVERGERNPSLTRVVELASALGVDPASLLRGLGFGRPTTRRSSEKA